MTETLTSPPDTSMVAQIAAMQDYDRYRDLAWEGSFEPAPRSRVRGLVVKTPKSECCPFDVGFDATVVADAVRGCLAKCGLAGANLPGAAERPT